MRRSVRFGGLILAVTLAVAGIAAERGGLTARAQAKAAGSAEVEIDNFSFGPAAITVSVGTTVTWTNHDDIPHTVVSADNIFKSKALDTDDRFSYTFTKSGEYPYFCSIHPKMTGKVVVTN